MLQRKLDGLYPIRGLSLGRPSALESDLLGRQCSTHAYHSARVVLVERRLRQGGSWRLALMSRVTGHLRADCACERPDRPLPRVPRRESCILCMPRGPMEKGSRFREATARSFTPVSPPSTSGTHTHAGKPLPHLLDAGSLAHSPPASSLTALRKEHHRNMTTINTHRIYLEPTRRNVQGQLYRVRLDSPDGRIIVQGSVVPEHAACRSLVRIGITGQLEVWGPEGSTPRMIIRDIERTAGMRVSDDAVEGLRVRSLTASATNDNPSAGIRAIAS